jgi:hypothetical protein
MIAQWKLASLLAGAAILVQPVAAAAANGRIASPCITEAEISSMVVYAVPSVIQSANLRCSEALSSRGFLARQGQTLAGRYIGLQDKAWPQAKSGFMKFASTKSASNADKLDILATLPDDAVRPLVDALVVQELAGKIAVKDCRKVERIMEAISPIEPEAAGDLIGVIASLAGLENPSICPAAAA